MQPRKSKKRKEASAPQAKSRRSPYHNAAFSAFKFYLLNHEKNGDVTLEDEYHLSERPLRIDIMIIKKNRNIEINTVWGRVFRGHNVVEYKSPTASALSITDFDKVNGYVRIYAAQNKIKITDMTATFVCFRKPVKLFETLEREFCFEILQECDGIYYIMYSGIPVENTLAMQVVVTSELREEDEFVLKTLRPGLDGETARKTKDFVDSRSKEEQCALAYWWITVTEINYKTYIQEAEMTRRDKMFEEFKAYGVWDKYEREATEKGRAEGKLEGIRGAYALFKKGYTLEETMAKLKLNTA